MDLKSVCKQLAARWPHQEPYMVNCLVTEHSVDLLERLLTLFPNERITAKEALKHRFFNDLKE